MTGVGRRQPDLTRIACEAGRFAGAAAAVILVASRPGELHPAGEWGVAAGATSIVSTPLTLADEVVGFLDLYLEDGAPRVDENRAVVADLAARAAEAVRDAELADRQRRRMAGIELILGDLRARTHEHANQLHAIGALIMIGEGREARRFVGDLLRDREGPAATPIEGSEGGALLGILLAEIAIAHESGVRVQIDPRSHLPSFSGPLSEAVSIPIVGGLLECASARACDLSPERRRVVFETREEDDAVVFGARDLRSSPVSARSEDAPYRATCWVGEALLREEVGAAAGSLSTEFGTNGTSATVRLPR